MTISCIEKGVDLNDGVQKMIGAMVEDYVDWTNRSGLTEEHAEERGANFANKFEIPKVGNISRASVTEA